MPQYVFILGHNPKLSAAEIKAVLPRAKVIIETGNFLILEIGDEIPSRQVGTQDDNISCQTLLNRLGGTIKIGTVISPKVDKGLIVSQLKQLKTTGRLNFGLSYYNCPKDDLGIEIKRELKKQGISSRLVTSRDKALSSVVVAKNKCIEFLILSPHPHPNPLPPSREGEGNGGGGQNKWLAQTCAVQEFEEYSKRDYGRPVRDLLSGSMPPKLAKIMINLAQAPAGATILDPFCGSGTVLQEALLLGYKVIGSDISNKAIDDTKKNIQWLIQKYLSVRHSEAEGRRISEILHSVQDDTIKLFQADVRELSKKVDQIDAIVTEPYLGPLLKGREDKLELHKIINELSKLYLKAFGEFRKILASGGKIVIVFPAFRLGKEILELPILEQIKKLGFAQLNKDKLIYSRPDQKVWRQIYIFL